MLYLPPGAPDRRHQPQGAQQTRCRPASTTPARRGRSAGTGSGGHEALDPELGTGEEFDTLVATAREHGIDVALDLAVQCSADHPWLTEHPEWFNRRPDGTLKYAENPPKKYQDIYNVNFNCEDWRGLWDALLGDRAGLGRARGADLPRRQPAHQAVRLLGVAHRGDPPRPPRRPVPGRGVHAPARHAATGQARLQPVLHVLHVEERPLGAARVPLRARPRARARVLPAELLRQHARHPHRLPRRRRPVGVLHPPSAGVAAEPHLRRLLGLRALRERARHPGLGGVHGLREVRDQGARASMARCCRSSRA